MNRKILTMLIAMAGLFCVVVEASNDSPERACLNWDIQSGQAVDKDQSTERYFEAAHYVEDWFGLTEDSLRPCLTVHVGESCPVSESSKSCMSAETGDLYLSNWEVDSPATIAQATVVTAVLQLVDGEEDRKPVTLLLAENWNDYADDVTFT